MIQNLHNINDGILLNIWILTRAWQHRTLVLFSMLGCWGN